MEPQTSMIENRAKKVNQTCLKERQIDVLTDRRTDRQTDFHRYSGHTHTHTNTHTHTHTHTPLQNAADFHRYSGHTHTHTYTHTHHSRILRISTGLLHTGNSRIL